MIKTPQQLRHEKLQRRKKRIALARQNQREGKLLHQQQSQAAEQKRLAGLRPKKQKKPSRNVGNAENLGWKPEESVVKAHDYTAYIVGGGPSLEHFNWSLLDQSKFVVGINSAYTVLPHSQVSYFTDDDWYALHKKQGFLNHPSVKIKGSLNPSKMGKDVHIRQMHLTGEKGLDMSPNRIKHGRNSPYAAINMLIQWGFKKIYLLGLDMKHGRPDNTKRNGKGNSKKKTHWHGGHRRTDGEQTYKSFMRNYRMLPELIKPLKVTIINVNDSSLLKAFPEETYIEHFGST